MEYGALSPASLREQCFLVGEAFGRRYLGTLLYELVLIESKAGTGKSAHGGVCSISHALHGFMIRHHAFYRHERRIGERLGIDMRRIKFESLATNPALSLICAGAWFLSNADGIPENTNDRARLYSRYWQHLSVGFYTDQCRRTARSLRL